jgi:hypothetical protein
LLCSKANFTSLTQCTMPFANTCTSFEAFGILCGFLENERSRSSLLRLNDLQHQVSQDKSKRRRDHGREMGYPEPNRVGVWRYQCRRRFCQEHDRVSFQGGPASTSKERRRISDLIPKDPKEAARTEAQVWRLCRRRSQGKRHEVVLNNQDNAITFFACLSESYPKESQRSCPTVRVTSR